VKVSGIIRIVTLVIIMAGLGFQVYRILKPDPKPEPPPVVEEEAAPEPEEPTEVAVGLDRVQVMAIKGAPIGTSRQKGVETLFYEDGEVNILGGKVASFRLNNGRIGTIRKGDQEVAVDVQRNISVQ
jgi:hypothetical protein